MDDLLTPSNVMFVLGILGIIFSVYNYFRNPQENIEKKQALNEKDMASKASVLTQKEMESKANLLAQQVQWEKESNEKKFAEFEIRLDNSMTIAQNHIHTIDVKVDGVVAQLNTMGINLAKLSTIIDERIPAGNKKKTDL